MSKEVVASIIQLLSEGKTGILILLVFPLSCLVAISYSFILIKQSIDKNSGIIKNNTKMVKALISLYLAESSDDVDQMQKAKLLDIEGDL
jgi:hypothetical protein